MSLINFRDSYAKKIEQASSEKSWTLQRAKSNFHPHPSLNEQVMSTTQVHGQFQPIITESWSKGHRLKICNTICSEIPNYLSSDLYWLYMIFPFKLKMWNRKRKLKAKLLKILWCKSPKCRNSRHLLKSEHIIIKNIITK